MKLTPCCLILLATLLIGTSCSGRPANSGGTLSAAKLGTYLDRVEMGYAFGNQPVVEKQLLDQMEMYILANSERLYATDAMRLSLHRGLIRLYGSDFLRAFRILKGYSEATGDWARPAYHIGRVLNRQFAVSGSELLGIAALSTRASFPSPLSTNQQLSILAFCNSYPYKKMVSVLSEDMLDDSTLLRDVRSELRYHLTYKPNRSDVERLYGIHIVTEEDIELLARDSVALDTALLDYLIDFYLHPYHLDYDVARAFADMRDSNARVGPYYDYRIANLMRVYLGVNRHEKVLELLRSHASSISESSGSQLHFWLLVSAA